MPILDRCELHHYFHKNYLLNFIFDPACVTSLVITVNTLKQIRQTLLTLSVLQALQSFKTNVFSQNLLEQGMMQIYIVSAAHTSSEFINMFG